jgi:tRNA G18 (ribose-2'-O)-methylase SpoU
MDKYQGMSVEEIVADYDKNACDASVAMFHIEGDFNLSTVVRNANFFGFKDTHYVGGKKSWDRRGAVGTHNYIDLTFHREWEQFIEYCISNNYTPVAVENNVKNTKSIYEITSWPERPMFIFGEERTGIPDFALSWIEKYGFIVEVPCFGTVRSVNVGTCSGILMAYYRQSLIKK